MAASARLLVTVKVKVTSAPGSSTAVALAVFVTEMSGRTSSKVTVVLSLPRTAFPSSSVPDAVAVLV